MTSSRHAVVREPRAWPGRRRRCPGRAPAVGGQRPLDVAADDRRARPVRPAPTKPASASTIACGSSRSTAAAPRTKTSSGAKRSTVVPRRVARRQRVERGRRRRRRGCPRSGSSAGTVALRVVERGRRDDAPRGRRSRRGRGTASCAASRASSALPSSGEVQLAGHVADDLAVGPRSASPRSAPAPSIVKPEPAAVVVELGGPLQRGAADERRLLHPDRPVHAEPARGRVELGVHADDDVALLEPQPEQRLEAVRPDAEVRAERPSAPATARPSGRPGGAARRRPRR